MPGSRLSSLRKRAERGIHPSVYELQEGGLPDETMWPLKEKEKVE
jgi:hypothetical protein